MQKRTSHKKSRAGCKSCKQKHIKCDEQGPPCANCVARKTTCTYAQTRPNRTTSLVHSSSSRSRSPPDWHVGGVADSFATRRILELELMHRWSTITYQSFGTLPDEHPIMQHELPRLAFGNEPLMNGILALSSFDLARSVGEAHSSKYAHAGIEFYDSLLRSYRAQLRNQTPENSSILLHLAMLVANINMAMVHCPQGPNSHQTVLDRMPAIFHMLEGATMVGMRNLQTIIDEYAPLRTVMSMGSASSTYLTPDAHAAIERLNRLNDRIHLSANADVDVLSAYSTVHEMYRFAICFLQECFAEDARKSIIGFFLSFPGAIGADFTLAIQKKRPLALLILMHWTICMNGMNSNSWWSASIGARLVMEISDVLAESEISSMPEYDESLAWTREQYKLPLLLTDSPSLRTPSSGVVEEAHEV